MKPSTAFKRAAAHIESKPRAAGIGMALGIVTGIKHEDTYQKCMKLLRAWCEECGGIAEAVVASEVGHDHFRVMLLCMAAAVTQHDR